MARKRVGVLESHEVPGSSEPKVCCGRAIAEYLVRRRYARQIGKRLIQMVNAKAKDAIKQAKAARDAAKKIVEKVVIGFWDGPLGRGNLLPFAKAHNYGDKLHYEMPHAGDRTAFARSRRKEFHPSSRPIFNQPGIQWANYVRQVSA